MDIDAQHMQSMAVADTEGKIERQRLYYEHEMRQRQIREQEQLENVRQKDFPLFNQQEQARIQQQQQDQEQVASMVREAQTVNNQRQEAQQYVGRLTDFNERSHQEQMNQARQEAEQARQET